MTDNAIDDLKCDILLFFATQIEAKRPEACLNAVRFVLAALQKTDKVLTE